MPFWPGPGAARGKAETSLGDTKSYAASGHILNSSIVRQEEMCLVNVAVTTLKHHNLILTTSLRRHRSDKHEELRIDEAGVCPLHGAHGSCASPTPGPTLHTAAPARWSRFQAWRASCFLLVGCRTHLNCKPTSAEGILLSRFLLQPAVQQNRCTQNRQISAPPHLGGYFDPLTFTSHTQSFLCPRGFVSTFMPGWMTAAFAKQEGAPAAHR